MNHVEAVWIYFLIYFSARLFFMDTQLLLSPQKAEPAFPVKRILWGLTVLLFISQIETAFLLIILHGIVVCLEYLVFKTARFAARTHYAGQLISALILLPTIISLLIPLVSQTINPVHTVFLDFIQTTVYLNPLLQSDMADKLAAVGTGFIFTLKEATIIIRFALQRIHAVPSDATHPDKQDEKEYERGRFIGNLERSLIYFLIIFNQIGAIAIIIALKSLARFQKMDDKDFAEYFLIGSFLSIIMAAIPAVLVKYL